MILPYGANLGRMEFSERTGRGDPFAGGDPRRVANDGHQIAVAACLRPQNAEAILGVVEGDPLDDAGEEFLGR
jgi:hypothetical protein